LHSRNYRIVNALLVKRNDLVDANSLFDSVLTDLLQNHDLTNTMLAQRDDVIHRKPLGITRSLNLGLLLLVRILLVGLLVLLLAEQISSHGTDRTTDQCAFGSFIILVSDNASNDCTSCTAGQGATLRVGELGLDRRNKNGRHKQRKIANEFHDTPQFSVIESWSN
jgi:hypothetical protein